MSRTLRRRENAAFSSIQDERRGVLISGIGSVAALRLDSNASFDNPTADARELIRRPRDPMRPPLRIIGRHPPKILSP